jgi:hypothetical protein
LSKQKLVFNSVTKEESCMAGLIDLGQLNLREGLAGLSGAARLEAERANANRALRAQRDNLAGQVTGQAAGLGIQYGLSQLGQEAGTAATPASLSGNGAQLTGLNAEGGLNLSPAATQAGQSAITPGGLTHAGGAAPTAPGAGAGTNVAGSTGTNLSGAGSAGGTSGGATLGSVAGGLATAAGVGSLAAGLTKGLGGDGETQAAVGGAAGLLAAVAVLY